MYVVLCLQSSYNILLLLLSLLFSTVVGNTCFSFFFLLIFFFYYYLFNDTHKTDNIMKMLYILNNINAFWKCIR
jgi:hypothetical protein